ncbi:protein-lysine N-methyltransferase EFM6 isoform X2 [Nymphaea colorata]|uniref:protein-lysine N-methyltransferase EFM6 isoform X2 n=1 Tax=Nymphaea colorata TaxID=210225 RepID=UPI00129E3004|nr:protein-lysine N-methyltransferase EFM6 isoform X2 [Nymphaea colorata]
MEEEDPDIHTTSSNDSNDEVMSEIHLGCPPSHMAPYISRFRLYSPHLNATGDSLGSLCASIIEDKEGDLDVPRRKNRDQPTSCPLLIQHRITSSIPSVGLQVWKAAFLLVDFILHQFLTSSDFSNEVALELGSGTGLVGIVLARFAKIVFLTDRDAEILDNCATNVQLNRELFKCDNVLVRELDWKKSWPPIVESSEMRYAWSSSEIHMAEQASLLLAADVIYCDELTDSLFDTLECLMSRGSEKVLYLSLEKRYNFTIDALDTVANGYLHFLKYLEDEESAEGSAAELSLRSAYFVGKRIDIKQIPQYVREYERGNDLEIWQIRYVRSMTT